MTDFQKFKRTHLIFLAIGGVVLISSIVGTLLGNILSIIGLPLGLLWVCLISWDFLRHKVIFCKECGHKFNYETEVGYDQRDEVVYDKKRVATVDFDCTCSKCGATREFSRRFTTAYIDDKGNIHYSNLRKDIKNLFKG